MAAPNTLRKHGEKQILSHFYFYAVEVCTFCKGFCKFVRVEYLQYLMKIFLAFDYTVILAEGQ